MEDYIPLLHCHAARFAPSSSLPLAWPSSRPSIRIRCASRGPFRNFIVESLGLIAIPSSAHPWCPSYDPR